MGLFATESRAQVTGLTLRSPPMTHAFVNSGDILAGIGLSYSKVENPGYQIADVIPESVTTRETFGFFAIGLADSIAIAVSTNPTDIKISGTESGSGVGIETTLKSSRTYYYIIPTLYRWERNRIALIWGKGTATIQENKTLSIREDSYQIGTTGLIGEFFLGEAFSFVPWLSWPYLLFDISPPSVAEFQEPDYGFDGILHFGEVKISLSLIFQALDTIDKNSDSNDDKRKTSSSENETTQESYAVSISLRF